MFELTKEEYESLRCKYFTLKSGRGMHSKYLPFAFTREGIAMLSGLLRSEIAVKANINIMRAFFQMQEALLIVGDALGSFPFASFCGDFKKRVLLSSDFFHPFASKILRFQKIWT